MESVEATRSTCANTRRSGSAEPGVHQRAAAMIERALVRHTDHHSVQTRRLGSGHMSRLWRHPPLSLARSRWTRITSSIAGKPSSSLNPATPQSWWNVNPLDGVQETLSELPQMHGISKPEHARTLEVRYLRAGVPRFLASL